MEPLVISRKPESIIQDKIVKKLRYCEWFVKETHGNKYQSGFPDLYATHSIYQARWIEVKVATQFSFTPAQVKDLPKFNANGSPIFILVDDTDEEYEKLFKPSNLNEYMACYLDGCTNIIAWRAGRRK